MSILRKRPFQAAVVFVITLLIMGLDWHFNGEAASRRQVSLKSELEEIHRIPDTKKISLNSSLRTSAGVLDEVNVTRHNALEIEEWYSTNLRDAGWISKGSELRGDDRAFRFCRNKETLFLLLPKKASQDRSTDTVYRVQIGWGGPWKCV